MLPSLLYIELGDQSITFYLKRVVSTWSLNSVDSRNLQVSGAFARTAAVTIFHEAMKASG